jgi:hypothetical protein
MYLKSWVPGLLGIKSPVEYGGLDLDWLTLGLAVMKELDRE